MISLPAGLSLSSFSSFYLQGKDPYFFVTDSITQHTKVLRFDSEKSGLQVYSLESSLPFLKEKHPVLLFRDPGGDYFTFSVNEQLLNIYNESGKDIAALPLSLKQKLGKIVLITAYNADTAVLLATTNGLLVYNKKKRSFSIAELKGDTKSVAGNKEIRCLLDDGKGSIWMGTFGEGLLRLDNRRLAFKNIPLSEISANKFRRMIFGLYHWGGDTIAAETGFNNFVFVKEGKLAGSVSDENITYNQIIKVTTGKEADRLSAFQSASLKHFFSRKSLFPFRFILHNDTTLIYFDQQLSVHTPSGTRKISAGYLVGNLVDDGTYYWFPAGPELYRLRKSDLKDTVYRFHADDPYSLSSSGLYYVALDEKKNIWIGTRDGLNHFDRTQNKFFRYTTREGLTDDVIYTVLPDGKGNLWLSTNQGISRFNMATKTFTNFSRRDGLLNTEFNRQGAVMTKDRVIYLSGTSGIDYFLPDEIGPSSPPAAVILSELKLNNEISFIRERLRLPYYINNLSFSYSANDFIRPDLVYYRYRLKESEPWTVVRGVNIVSFNAMQPGSYRFEVASSYDNQNWSNSSAVHIYIKTPWWKSGWFYILLTTGIILLLLLFYRYRINRLKEMFFMRNKISQDLHDEVGATLSGVNLMSELAVQKIKKGENTDSQRLLERIKEESKEMAEKMNDIVWAINPVNDTMEKVLSKIKSYGNNLCTSAGIVFHFSKPELKEGVLNMQVRNNIYLISKEAINNAVKYSAAKNIRFELFRKKNYYVLRIEDDGNGFDINTVKPGNGLLNMQSRAKEIGEELTIRSAPSKGTVLELQF